MKKLTVVLTAATCALVAPALADHIQGSREPSVIENAQAADQMITNLGTGLSGNPDTDFVTLMMANQAGAIDLAAVELKYGRNPKVRTLARRFAQARQQEVRDLRDVLAETVGNPALVSQPAPP